MSQTPAQTNARLLALAALSVLCATSASAARAADGEGCEEALRRLDASAQPPAGDVACAEALKAAEENQWQLMLDLAFAEEETGDPRRAWETYVRFLDASAGRGDSLANDWAERRQRAEASVARLEKALLKTHARVTVTPRPETRTVQFFGEVLRPKARPGPVTRFLPVGSHTVIAADGATGRYREVTLTVAAGEQRDMVIDLDPASPPVAEVAVRQSQSAAASPQATPAPIEGVSRLATTPRRQPLWRSVGAAALGVGVAATAVGAGFMASANGLFDDAACDGALCDLEAAQRARIRADAEVAEDRAVASFVTGGLFIAGGATALILEALGVVGAPEAGSTASAPRLKRLAPTFGRGGAGMAAAVAF
jgi:hypothetical protein